MKRIVTQVPASRRTDEVDKWITFREAAKVPMYDSILGTCYGDVAMTDIESVRTRPMCCIGEHTIAIRTKAAGNGSHTRDKGSLPRSQVMPAIAGHRSHLSLKWHLASAAL